MRGKSKLTQHMWAWRAENLVIGCLPDGLFSPRQFLQSLWCPTSLSWVKSAQYDTAQPPKARAWPGGVAQTDTFVHLRLTVTWR